MAKIKDTTWLNKGVPVSVSSSYSEPARFTRGSDERTPRRTASHYFAVCSVALVTFALVVLGMVNPAPAHAAVTGQITAVTMSKQTLSHGQTGTVCFDFSFPSGSEGGDTVTLHVPNDFTLSPPTAYPSGQPILGPGDVVLAMVTVTASMVTITRVPQNSQWGEIESTVPPCVTYTYNGGIQNNQTETVTWEADNADFPIVIEGTPIVPATYGPKKWGSFFYSSTGEPRIRWVYHSPTGREAAATVNFSDQIGPGQELVCSSISGTIRWWDQSYPEGQDSATGLGVSWSNGTYSCDPNTGFSGVLAPEIPAPQAGGNPNSAGGPGTERVAYMNLVYETVVTDFSLANTTGWSNSALFEGQKTTSDTRNAIVSFPANATGNRGITVSKTVTGYTDDLDPEASYRLQVSCVNSDGSAAIVTPTDVVQVKNGQTANVYAPIGSTCSVTEPDPGTASPVFSPDVALTHFLDDTFELSVTNDFDAPLREVTVSKIVTGYAAGAEGKRFVLTVDCVVGDASAEGFPQEMSLAGGETATVQAPVGSQCGVSEADSQGAVATASEEVTITVIPDDTFALSVTNNFATPVVELPDEEPAIGSLNQGGGDPVNAQGKQGATGGSLAQTGGNSDFFTVATTGGLVALLAAVVLLAGAPIRRRRSA